MKKAGAFAALKILHTAMFIGQILFVAVLFYLGYNKILLPALAEEDKILQVIAIAVSAAAFFIGTNIFKKKLLNIRDDVENNNIADKFIKYRAACIVQWAMLEGASLFSCICYFLTGNYAFLALAILLIIVFALLTPVKIKTALQLGVTIEDLDNL